MASRTIFRAVILFSLLLGTGLLHGQTPTPAPTPTPCPEAKWTVMVYMCGDNEMEGYAIKDYMKLAKEITDNATLADYVRVAVQFDRHPEYDSSNGNWTTAKRFVVAKDKGPEEANQWGPDLGEINMGTQLELEKFINWAKTFCPGENYALVLWSNFKSVAGYVDAVKDIVYDESNSDTLTLTELKGALKSTGKVVRAVVFDGDMMGMAEVAYQLKDVVPANSPYSYMSGSEDQVPVTGLPLGAIPRYIYALPLDGPQKLLEFLAMSITNQSKTYSTLKLAGPNNIGVLATKIRELGDTIRGHIDDDNRTAIADNASAVISMIGNTVGYAVADDSDNHTHSHGVSIYFPQFSSGYNPDYAGLTFITDNSSWVDFLNEFYSSMGEKFVFSCRDQTETYFEADTIDLYHFCKKLIEMPRAVDDTATAKTFKDTDIDVVANDYEPNGDPKYLQGVIQGPNGTVSVTSDGKVRYKSSPILAEGDTDYFMYLVSDGKGNVDTGKVEITIGASNKPPVAVDDFVTIDEDTMIDIVVLSNDSDPEADPFMITGMNRGSHGTIALNPDNTIRYIPDADYNGTDTFTYIIRDSEGGEDTGTVTVTINPVADPPKVQLVKPENREVFQVGDEILLFAEGTDDGWITQVDFYEGNTLLTSLTAGPYRYKFTSLPVGTYLFYAIATDNEGAVATSNLARITVENAPENAPRVRMTAPTSGQIFAAGSDIPLAVEASDPNGTIVKIEYYAGTTRLATVTSSPFGYTWPAVPVGAYSLTARATDNDGAVTTSIPVAIQVNSLPVVGADAATTAEDMLIDIDVLSNDADPDGQTLTLASVANGANGTTIAVTNGRVRYVPNFNFNGTDTFTYVVRDTLGGQATGQVTVTVTGVADPPTVRLTQPAKGATFVAGNSITLAATAQDVDGQVARVDFYQGTTLVGTAMQSPWQVVWTNVPAGEYWLTAKATDSDGLSVASTIVSIKILKPGASGDDTQVTPTPTGTLTPGAGTTITPTTSIPGGGIIDDLLPGGCGCSVPAVLVLGLFLAGLLGIGTRNQ